MRVGLSSAVPDRLDCLIDPTFVHGYDATRPALASCNPKLSCELLRIERSGLVLPEKGEHVAMFGPSFDALRNCPKLGRRVCRFPEPQVRKPRRHDFRCVGFVSLSKAERRSVPAQNAVDVVGKPGRMTEFKADTQFARPLAQEIVEHPMSAANVFGN